MHMQTNKQLDWNHNSTHPPHTMPTYLRRSCSVNLASKLFTTKYRNICRLISTNHIQGRCKSIADRNILKAVHNSGRTQTIIMYFNPFNLMVFYFGLMALFTWRVGATAPLAVISVASSAHNLSRPIQPSHQLPIVDLEESPDKIYNPKNEDLNVQTLTEKLGKNYDPNFMSVKRPFQASNATVDDSYARIGDGQWIPVGKVPDDIKEMKFKVGPALERGPKFNLVIGSKLRRKVRQFLWTYTYCPVIHVWKDLGIRFWPRWLREGQCLNKRSCSLPRGMSCKPSMSANKVVLRWHCQNWDQAKYCKWISVRYPVIVKCSCSC